MRIAGKRVPRSELLGKKDPRIVVIVQIKTRDSVVVMQTRKKFVDKMAMKHRDYVISNMVKRRTATRNS